MYCGFLQKFVRKKKNYINNLYNENFIQYCMFQFFSLNKVEIITNCSIVQLKNMNDQVFDDNNN